MLWLLLLRILHICVTAKSNVIKYTVKYTVNQSPIAHIVVDSSIFIFAFVISFRHVWLTPICSQLEQKHDCLSELGVSVQDALALTVFLQSEINWLYCKLKWERTNVKDKGSRSPLRSKWIFLCRKIFLLFKITICLVTTLNEVSGR